MWGKFWVLDLGFPLPASEGDTALLPLLGQGLGGRGSPDAHSSLPPPHPGSVKGWEGQGRGNPWFCISPPQATHHLLWAPPALEAKSPPTLQRKCQLREVPLPTQGHTATKHGAEILSFTVSPVLVPPLGFRLPILKIKNVLRRTPRHIGGLPTKSP